MLENVNFAFGTWVLNPINYNQSSDFILFYLFSVHKPQFIKNTGKLTNELNRLC